jgi:hypothetical protein
MVYEKLFGWDCMLERGDKIRRNTWEELRSKHPKSYRQAMENLGRVKRKKELLFAFNLADGDLVLCGCVKDICVNGEF